jgi:predicted pyridoxine 5'-phosphate oxidase superfamily flavin-nucleotide-binding protein
MDEDVLRVLAQTKVIPVATASSTGAPNVVPMTFVKALGDSAVLIADNYMDKGASNLEENAVASICVWDLETKRAYQIKGAVKIHRSGALYDDMVAWVKEAKPDAPAKAAVVLSVEQVFICHAGPERGKDVALP